MNDSLQSADPGTQKRRSTRIVQAVPITVTGTDALGQPFKERTTTVMVNCHGCKYQSKHYVPKNSMVSWIFRGRRVGRSTRRDASFGCSVRARCANYFRSGWSLKLPGISGALRFLRKTGRLEWTYPTGDLTGMLELTTAAEPAAGISPQPLPPIGPPPIPLRLRRRKGSKLRRHSRFRRLQQSLFRSIHRSIRRLRPR